MASAKPKAPAKPVRCDRWRLLADADTLRMAQDTVVAYRKLTNALATVFLAHWPEVAALPVQDLERLFHETKENPDSPYGKWFKENHRKVPSYLRRAATMAAHGAVSSFMSNHRRWQGGDRRMRAQRPPRWGGINAWPTLYAAKGGAGAMIRRDCDVVEIKLLDVASGDWKWRKARVVKRGRRHDTKGAEMLSPSLVLDKGGLALVQPYELPRTKRVRKAEVERVCAVDLGVNTQATCSVVGADGTVVARRFIHLGAHIDRRDKALHRIRGKARLTMGGGGKDGGEPGRLGKGFCKAAYARAVGLNRAISRTLSRDILEFAKLHGATVVVFEDLKRFRPKGGAKRSPMKQRFHGWLHRALVGQAEASAEERGMKVALVHPRGTSALAFDGSGPLRRNRHAHGQATFRTGKRYDCDLSASYNVGARWFASVGRLPSQHHDGTTPAGRNPGWPARGERAGPMAPTTAGPRMPVTLSSLWAERPEPKAA